MTAWWRIAGALAAATALGGAAEPVAPDFGPRLERFTYAWPVEMMKITVVGQPAEMAFIDVAPAQPNGRVAVLLHCKNFCGATWESAAAAGA